MGCIQSKSQNENNGNTRTNHNHGRKHPRTPEQKINSSSEMSEMTGSESFTESSSVVEAAGGHEARKDKVKSEKPKRRGSIKIKKTKRNIDEISSSEESSRKELSKKEAPHRESKDVSTEEPSRSKEIEEVVNKEKPTQKKTKKKVASHVESNEEKPSKKDVKIEEPQKEAKKEDEPQKEVKKEKEPKKVVAKEKESEKEAKKEEESQKEVKKEEEPQKEVKKEEEPQKETKKEEDSPQKEIKKDELIVGEVKKSTTDDGKVVLEFTIPQDDHKYIVGKGGENIKSIRSETGADIQLDPSKTKSDVIIITADDDEKANKAKDLVIESVKKVKDQHNDTEEWYQQFQKKVDEHARKRQEYFDAAQKAHEEGDGKLAKELSEKGKREGELMKEAQKEAARAVFKRRNEGNGDDVIDLHGLQVEPAVEITGEYLDKWANKPGKYIIITGKGNHSDEKGPKIRPAIEELLKERKIKYEDVPGQFEVTI